MKRLAYITDIHLDEQFVVDIGVNPDENWERILQDIRRLGIDEIIFGGDVGSNTAHLRFFKSLEGFRLHLTPGNHDNPQALFPFLRSDSRAGHLEIYDALEDDFLKYIFLDSSSERLSGQQFLWLKQALETKKKTLVFIHHPVLKVETYVDGKYPLAERDKVVEMMEAAGNDIIVFCGHYHMKDERRRNNILQVISPAASYQMEANMEQLVTDSSQFGYTIININEDDVNWESIMNSSRAGDLVE